MSGYLLGISCGVRRETDDLIVVAVYAVLFMDWDTKGTPFDGVSWGYFWIWDLLSGLSAN